MNTAFISINTESGVEASVLNQIRKIDCVKEAFLVAGQYDIIARLDAENMQELRDTISFKIRKMDHIRAALTMIVV
jgi:DNA-binding Lrp family transcriptional regulator